MVGPVLPVRLWGSRTVLPLSLSLNVGYRYFMRHLAGTNASRRLLSVSIPKSGVAVRMRVTLIYPSVGRKPGHEYVRAWQMEPLSMALLASLTGPDIDVRFYDDRVEPIP